LPERRSWRFHARWLDRGGKPNSIQPADFKRAPTLLDFQDVFGDRGLAQGSIAWHIASQEAQDQAGAEIADVCQPDGKELISGLPGRSAFIQTGSLRAQPINTPQGFGLTGAAFSLDGSITTRYSRFQTAVAAASRQKQKLPRRIPGCV
jgi:hypothetical protein